MFANKFGHFNRNPHTISHKIFPHRFCNRFKFVTGICLTDQQKAAWFKSDFIQQHYLQYYYFAKNTAKILQKCD